MKYKMCLVAGNICPFFLLLCAKSHYLMFSADKNSLHFIGNT